MSYIIRFQAISAAAALLAACLSSQTVYAESSAAVPCNPELTVSFTDTAVPETQNELILTAGEYDEASGSGYIYDMFRTDEEREFYNRLLQSCMEVHESDGTYETIPFARFSDLIDYETAKEVGWIFHYNHPEFFWMDSHFWISGGSAMAFEVYECYQDGAERNAVKEQIEAVADDYISKACTYTTQYERAEYLFNQLREDIDYQEGDLDQSLVSAFIEKATVCAGYSKAYNLLCNAVGVEAVSIVGYNHGWNVIKLADKWYIADVTNGNFLYTEDEMRANDIELGARFTGTMTSSDGTVTEIDFYMHDVAEKLFPLYYDSFPHCDTVYTAGAGNVPAVTTAPSVTTTAVTTTTTTTTTTTAMPPAPAGSCMMGDLNNDSSVDLSDASLVLQIYAARAAGLEYSVSEAAFDAGDVNESSQLEIDDAALILTYYARNAAGLDVSWEDII